MKRSLSIQERLKDLRVERHLTLEQLSQQVPISRSALGAYESDDYKDISHTNLKVLAEFYGVSADYLLGLTENREQVNAELASLHLDDEAVALLRSGHINNRLLCEIMRHPEFSALMADSEIFIDGVATMHLNNFNETVDAIRTQLIQKRNPDEIDLYERTLERAHIREEEYFFHVTHRDWDSILRDLHHAHEHDVESVQTNPQNAQKIFDTFKKMTKRRGDVFEAMIEYMCKGLDIDYDRLPDSERETLKRFIRRSKNFKRVPSHSHKRRT